MTDIQVVKTIILVIMGFFAISLVVAFLKKEPDNIRRALIFGLILTGLYFGLDASKIDRLTWSEIKAHVFPPNLTKYAFTKDETFFENTTTTRYVFEENKGPTLDLIMQAGGKFLNITDIASVNHVLNYLGLKKVTHGVPELVSITGNTLNSNQYRWDDYHGGVLLIERGLCRETSSLTTRHCITGVTVIRK